MKSLLMTTLLDDTDRGFRLRGKYGTPGLYFEFDWPATLPGVRAGLVEAQAQVREWFEGHEEPEPTNLGVVEGEVELDLVNGTRRTNYACIDVHDILGEVYAIRWDLTVSVSFYGGPKLHDLTSEQLSWILGAMIRSFPEDDLNIGVFAVVRDRPLDEIVMDAVMRKAAATGITAVGTLPPPVSAGSPGPEGGLCPDSRACHREPHCAAACFRAVTHAPVDFTLRRHDYFVHGWGEPGEVDTRWSQLRDLVKHHPDWPTDPRWSAAVSVLLDRLSAAIPVGDPSGLKEDRRFERTPDEDQHINNCALYHYGPEGACGVCEGLCPDRRRILAARRGSEGVKGS